MKVEEKKDYKAIFKAIEESMYANSQNQEEMDKQIGWTRNYSYKNVINQYHTDREFDEYFYKKLVAITFYSGFKASTVEKFIDAINIYFPDIDTSSNLSDAQLEEIRASGKIIAHKRKLKACVNNAKVVQRIIEQYGSVSKLIESYEPDKGFLNLMLLNEALRAHFDYISDITVYHLMTDLGLQVLKPDRVITRIFERLGIIENRKYELHAIVEGLKFADAIGASIRYVDAVFVSYGQSRMWDGSPGICLDKPKCESCLAQKFCNYYKTTKGNLL